jgi:hypothetical protein
VWVGTLAAGTVARAVTGYFDGSALGWQARWSNCFETVNGFINSTDDLRIGSRAYRGDMLEVVLWKGVELSAAQVLDATAFFENKYFLTCANLTAANSTASGQCLRATDTGVCTMVCAGVTSRVFGASINTCSQGQWTGPAPVCEPLCPSLTLPENSQSCEKTVVSEGFDADTALLRWHMAPAIPASILASYWKLDNGTLLTTVGAQCAGVGASRSILHMYQPKWLDTMEPLQSFTVAFDVSLTSGLLGAVVRYADVSNYAFVSFDVGANATVCGAVVGGVALPTVTTAWTPQQSAAFVASPVHVDVSLTGANITVATSVPGAGCSLSVPSLPGGSVGFMSRGVGRFDNLTVTTACDGSGVQCAGMSSGMVCAMRCKQGYFAGSGAENRTCTMGVWSGGDLQCDIGAWRRVLSAQRGCCCHRCRRCIPLGLLSCAIAVSLLVLLRRGASSSRDGGVCVCACVRADRPTFTDTVRSVPENATANEAVGAPLVATHSSVDVTITYTVVGGNGTDLFRVGVCDGQVRVRVSDSLDFEDTAVFTLEVEARPNGIATSARSANVTVVVEDVPEPPLFNDTLVRYVLENQTAGAFSPIYPAIVGELLPRGPRLESSRVCVCVCVCVRVRARVSVCLSVGLCVSDCCTALVTAALSLALCACTPV